MIEKLKNMWGTKKGRFRLIAGGILVLFLIIALASCSGAKAHVASEAEHNARFCDNVGGETEARHEYSWAGGDSHVFVDCETADTVWEGGLDKRSSLDSVQQALFFSHITGKPPAIVIYDTDGTVGQYEHQIRVAAELAGVRFLIL